MVAAEGVRLAWHDLPRIVRAAVEDIVGWPVAEATTQRGGFSPGAAARIRSADGRRAFVKAVSSTQNPDSPDIHRREARVAAALPATAPVARLIGTYDDGIWVALVFSDVDGHLPALPWRADQLSMVLEGIGGLHEALTPSPAASVPDIDTDLAPVMTCWQRLSDDPAIRDRADDWCRRHLGRLIERERDWAAGVRGETLLHTDLRADNILLTGIDGIAVVDWPWATRGAAWVDVALMAPSVAAQGGPAPTELLRRCRSSTAVAEEVLIPLVVALAGYLTYSGLKPPPAGLPTLRRFQVMQGRAARAWVRELTGWS